MNDRTLKLNPSILIFALLLIWAVIGIAHLYTNCIVDKTVAMPTTTTMQWSTDTCWSGWMRFKN